MSCVHSATLLADLRAQRSAVGFGRTDEVSGGLHPKGIGTRLETAIGWLRILIDDAANRQET